MNTTNILTKAFSTPFESAPFSQIKQEDFEPAILELINQSKTEIDNIVNQIDLPNFKNTIEALEGSGKQLNRATAIFFNLNSAETNDYLEQVAQKLSPALAAYSNDIMLNAKLFNKIKKVYDTKDTFILNNEQKRLLDKTYKSFVRNGALLCEADKETLRNIDQELAMLGVQFSQNVLAETNSYYLHLTEEKDLDGLPPSVIEMAKGDAIARNLDGWVFTLQFPSITPFLKYSKNRALRKQIQLASGQKGFQDNSFNNTEIIKKILSLKHQRAQLLGFEDHAAFVLAERMAGDKNTVFQFLDELLVKARPFAQKEIEQLKALAKKDGINTIQAYDHAYYAELLKEEMYSISDEILKPYFSLQQVLSAAFEVATKLYGLRFQKRTDIDTYHQEVEVYEVLENGEHKALLYTDFFPRAGKRPGAWMTSYKDQYIDDTGNHHRPHISIVCNFSRPVGDTPSLLTFTEVTTLFHEFGHALHGILANTTYESLSGTNVYWDFVELPSQFMENFCFEPEFLKSFAKHHQTGEVLRDDLIEKIVASANFMQGYQTLRQLGFGILDMKYHTNQLSGSQDIETFEKDAIKETTLYPSIVSTSMSTSFSHIFAGGYAAGYYSYKWAEVLDADAFAYFKEKGIFDTLTAQKFKTLLSSGGTVDPMELYINFRGRKPDVNALLKRAGMV